MSFDVSGHLECFHKTYNKGDLTEKTLASLRSTFAGYGHKPSEAMWAGIRALVEKLEGMANGTLETLSLPLPP